MVDPSRTARRIVRDVLHEAATGHPNPDARTWARNELARRNTEDIERATAGFRAIGQALGRTYRTIQGLASAYVEGFADATADHLEDAEQDGDDEGRPTAGNAARFGAKAGDAPPSCGPRRASHAQDDVR